MNLTQQLNNFFSELVGEGKKFRGNIDIASHCGVDPSYPNRLTNEGIKEGSNIDKFLKFLEKLGVSLRLHGSEEQPRVIFANPRIHDDYKHLPHPDQKDYRCIPLTDMEVAAGPGLSMPDDPALKSWVLIYSQELALRQIRLMAARVGRDQKSMTPVIQPGDIVVIDKDDKDIKRPGIFMVRDKEEGIAMKRVKYFIKNKKPSVTFYSENAAEYPPSTYELNEYDIHPDKAVDKAIVGRCIWQWGNLELR